MPFEIETIEEVSEKGGGEEADGDTTDVFPRVDGDNGVVEEGGKEVREEGWRSEDVIVAEDGHLGGYLEDGVG